MDNLPQGHITTDKAVELINKHTKANPLVDIEFLNENIRYMNSARNYTIKLLQKNDKGQYYSGMHVVAVVETDRDLENLKYAIKEAYKRVTGRVVESEKRVRAVTTQVDDKAGSASNPRVNKKSKVKYGSKMESGSATVESVEAIEG